MFIPHLSSMTDLKVAHKGFPLAPPRIEFRTGWDAGTILL